MDLWQLHIFRHVVEKGSFSKAAEAVHLTQPTVSSHIKDLEDHFGCRLMDRLGRQAVTTPAGELLYAHAKKLLAARDEAENALHAFLGHPRGRLAIGGSTIPGNYILPGLIGPFVKEFPEVSVNLVVADTREIAHQTAEGLLELAVVGAVTPDRRLVHEPFLDDELILVVPAGHPFVGKKNVPIQDLASEPFVLREEGSGTRRSLSDMLATAGM
ncbi:MAG: LysR family transcriptional regulator, partial [Pseudomonadota bacterium]